MLSQPGDLQTKNEGGKTSTASRNSQFQSSVQTSVNNIIIKIFMSWEKQVIDLDDLTAPMEHLLNRELL